MIWRARVQELDRLQVAGLQRTLERYTTHKHKDGWTLRMTKRHNQTASDVRKIFQRHDMWVLDRLYSHQRDEYVQETQEYALWNQAEKRLAFAKCFLHNRLRPNLNYHTWPLGIRLNPYLLLTIDESKELLPKICQRI